MTTQIVKNNFAILGKKKAAMQKEKATYVIPSVEHWFYSHYLHLKKLFSNLLYGMHQSSEFNINLLSRNTSKLYNDLLTVGYFHLNLILW